ncbi:MAG TPA: N-6 DNA methylase [Micromonospora sp.]|nr:N-6 DNA methylase [Micromonospora sp.]
MQRNPTVTAADIARLAGVGRAAVSNWRKRHADFPTPVGGTVASPEFDLAQVEAWLRSQGKLPTLSTEDRLWRHLVAAGDNQAATLAAVGAFLLARQRGETPPIEPDDPRLAELLGEVAALADKRGAPATFDELWRHLSEPGAGLARATPDDLADLMVGLADVGGGSLLDPACGTGGGLHAAVRAGCTAVYGQELDEQAAELAGLWLALRNINGGVRAGDSLRADAFPDLAVDAVICHPPFGQTNWGQEELAHDPRWEYGLPPRTEPELAWLQHCLAHLRPDGYAVLLMPPAVAGRRAGRRIRSELLRNGAFRCVIALPARAAAPHGVPLHLWVLQRPAPDASPPANVLFIDAAGVIDGDLTAAYAEVLKAFREYAVNPNATVEEPGFAWTVPTIKLLGDDVDLTPARQQPASGTAETSEKLARTRERLTALVAELPQLLPETGARRNGAAAPLAVPVAELAKLGALQFIGPIRSTAAVDRDGTAGGAADERRVLTVQDVLDGQNASGRQEGGLTPEVVVQAGDVVVPMMARKLAARVVGADGALLGDGLYLLRPDPAVLDPWFLAGQLRTSTNERQASSLSGTPRFDVRRAQIPRLPLPDQRRYAEVFRQLDLFNKALRDVTSVGAELVQLTADGLASGTLHPAVYDAD